MKDRQNPHKLFKPKGSKYERAPLALPGINYKNHFAVDFLQWPYINSKGDIHVVTMAHKGWKCTCLGFTHHGKCKHIVSVHSTMVAE